jgi:hypothetical protein
MANDSKTDNEKVVLRIPLLLRIVSIFIVVEGVLGLLFFIAAGIFQLNDLHFTGNTELNGFSRNFYSFYIVLHIVLFAGFLLSGMFLLRLKKAAYYLFIINYLIFTGFGIYMNNTFAWTTIIVDMGFIAALTYYLKKMN